MFVIVNFFSKIFLKNVLSEITFLENLEHKIFGQKKTSYYPRPLGCVENYVFSERSLTLDMVPKSCDGGSPHGGWRFVHFWKTKDQFLKSKSYCWLHKLRTHTQRKIYGIYLGNINGIYKDYLRNVHKYFWHKIIRNKEHRCRLRRRPIGSVFLVSDYFIP